MKKLLGKCLVGPGGLHCNCCNPRIGSFAPKKRAETKAKINRYIRRTINHKMLPYEAEDCNES